MTNYSNAEVIKRMVLARMKAESFDAKELCRECHYGEEEYWWNHDISSSGYVCRKSLDPCCTDGDVCPYFKIRDKIQE